MNPQNIQETIQSVIDGLAPLAQKMQVPIQYLWQWALKRNFAIAVSEYVALGVFLILDIITYKVVRYGFKPYDSKISNYSNFDKSDTLCALGVFLSFISVIGTIILFVIVLSDANMRLLSPEFSTIQDIIGLIKN